MAAREAHGSKPKSNGNRNASVVSYDKASFESLDGSCASSESHIISPHPGSRELPPSRDERVDGWLRSTLRTEEPVQPAARASARRETKKRRGRRGPPQRSLRAARGPARRARPFPLIT